MLSGSGESNRRFLGRALAASLAIHLLFALVVPTLSTKAGTSPEIDTISFQHVTHITVEQPRQPMRPARPSPAAPPREITARTARARPAPQPTARAIAKAPFLPAPPEQAPAAASQPTVQTAQASASPAPAPPATPAAREVAAVAHPPGGYMPFGAEERDPVLDPNVRKQIEALGVRVTIHVSVSDAGHTRDVVFQTPVSRDVQTEIETLLADAAWDPAYCGGGIPCAGELTLKI